MGVELFERDEVPGKMWQRLGDKIAETKNVVEQFEHLIAALSAGGWQEGVERYKREHAALQEMLKQYSELQREMRSDPHELKANAQKAQAAILTLNGWIEKIRKDMHGSSGKKGANVINISKSRDES